MSYNYFYLLIYVVIMYFMFNQLHKYQVKDRNVYIDPLIDELMELYNGVTMYDISRPVVVQMEFEFHAMLVWTIHDAPKLTNLYGML